MSKSNGKSKTKNNSNSNSKNFLIREKQNLGINAAPSARPISVTLRVS